MPTNEKLDKVVNQEDNVNYEALASDMGWTPKDKFKGDQEKWVDAQVFYEKAEHVLPIVKKQRDDARKANDATKADLASVKADLEQTKHDAKEAIRFMQQGLEREYKAREAALKAEKADAISAGDGAKAIKIETEIDNLKAEKVEAKQEAKKEVEIATPQVHPEWGSWIKDNAWFNDDKRLNRLAITLGFDMAEEDKSLQGKDLWEAVKEELQTLYPQKFPEIEKQRAGAERGGKTTSNNGSGKTYANLPPEAKTQCDKIVKNNWGTKEKFCEIFYASEG